MAGNRTPPLDHVLWLGGSSCAGKTVIARRLALAHGLDTYHCDEHWQAHAERVDPARHPFFAAIKARAPESLFMRPVAEQVAELAGFYEEELAMVCDDLAARRGSGPLLVEGAGLLPALVAPLTRRAAWLVATPGFRRQCYTERSEVVTPLLAACRDPDLAFRRWMARDAAFAALIVEQAREAGVAWRRVDGRLPLRDSEAWAARQLGLAA